MRLLVLVVLAACGSGGSEQGAIGEPCYPNGTCNVGLSCFAGTCVAADAPPADASIDAPVDAPMVACVDDSAFEPNDSIQTAFSTGVDLQMQAVSYSNLALCPVGDKDHFAVSLSSGNKGIEVIASWPAAAPVELAFLNAGGTSIVNGTAMGTNAVRACAPNLPAGVYYARVTAAAETNNYFLSIKVLASCL